MQDGAWWLATILSSCNTSILSSEVDIFLRKFVLYAVDHFTSYNNYD
jgi:hypothetical protein